MCACGGGGVGGGGPPSKYGSQPQRANRIIIKNWNINESLIFYSFSVLNRAITAKDPTSGHCLCSTLKNPPPRTYMHPAEQAKDWRESLLLSSLGELRRSHSSGSCSRTLRQHGDNVASISVNRKGCPQSNSGRGLRTLLCGCATQLPDNELNRGSKRENKPPLVRWRVETTRHRPAEGKGQKLVLLRSVAADLGREFLRNYALPTEPRNR